MLAEMVAARPIFAVAGGRYEWVLNCMILPLRWVRTAAYRQQRRRYVALRLSVAESV